MRSIVKDCIKSHRFIENLVSLQKNKINVGKALTDEKAKLSIPRL